MTWSYDPTLSTNRDKVRFYVGDVDSSDQLRSNEEITAILALEGTVLEAAAATAESLAAQYARKSDKETGELRIWLSKRYEQFRDTAEYLRGRTGAADSLTAVPHIGGISVSRKDTVEADTDRVGTAFYVGMKDNPRVSGATNLSEEEEP